MHNGDYIPSSDGDFGQWEVTFMNVLTPNATEWGVPGAVITDLRGKQSAWQSTHAIAENPATRTSIAIEAKNEARAAYEKALRSAYREYIMSSRSVTNEQRLALGVPIHKEDRTPVPVPVTFPLFEVITTLIRWLIIDFRDQGMGHSNAKPFGVHGAELLYGIADGSGPLAFHQLTHSVFCTHSPFRIEFADELRGKTVYFCLRWENTRGQKGPWSEIVSAIIP
jgi:hypothetical protein